MAVVFWLRRVIVVAIAEVAAIDGAVVGSTVDWSSGRFLAIRRKIFLQFLSQDLAAPCYDAGAESVVAGGLCLGAQSSLLTRLPLLAASVLFLDTQRLAVIC